MRTESQNHGFMFEEQVKNRINEFLELMKDIKYTNKWDIPPVSVKSFQFERNRIEFGSIENMFKIEESFFLVLIGYEQIKNIKKVVFSDIVYIKQEDLIKLKGLLSLEDIKKLNEVLTSYKKGDHASAQEWYKSILDIYQAKTKFQINFKVDSKTQRRIQCSLKLDQMYEMIKVEIEQDNRLNIEDIQSTQRQRNKKST